MLSCSDQSGVDGNVVLAGRVQEAFPGTLTDQVQKGHSRLGRCSVNFCTAKVQAVIMLSIK